MDNKKYIFFEDDPVKFSTYLDQYNSNNLSSYRYTKLHLDFLLNYSMNLIENKSFVLVENNSCMGVCFLPIEKNDNIKSISTAKSYTIAPIATNRKSLKSIYEQIEHISKDESIDVIKFYIDPLILEYQNKYNHLLEFDFIDSSTFDCFIDLKSTKEDLWKNIRKSYKSLINGVSKNSEYEIMIMDKDNADYDIHEKYRNLHFLCSGKSARDKTTFDIQFKMLKNGLATLIGLKHNGKFIGLNYFYHYQKTVIYASGADDPEYENKKYPIYHSILWNAILHFKKKSFEFLEFSQPCSYNTVNGFDDYLDQKQINISSFKKAMGTYKVPFFRGVKYYNQSVAQKDIERFKEQIIDKIRLKDI